MKKLKFHIYNFLADLLRFFPGIWGGTLIRTGFYRFHLKRCGKRFRTRTGTLILAPEAIEIGNNVRINNDCWINGGGGIVMGNDVIIGPKVIIHSANHNFDKLDIPIRLQGHNLKKTVIKDNVWIGAGAIILPGVVINSGAVIAAGAVVSKEIPENAVAGGVPAKVIKIRG
jgi:acetyltransferase-like isoleucine patch superfamily enzyme